MRDQECSSNPFLAHCANEAVRDWLETQSHITRYWRDVLVSSGASEALIAALDEHAAFLASAAHVDEGRGVLTQ